VRRTAVIIGLVLAAVAADARAEPLPPVANLEVAAPTYDSGEHIDIRWKSQAEGEQVVHIVVRFSARPPADTAPADLSTELKAGVKGVLQKQPDKDKRAPWFLRAPGWERPQPKTAEACDEQDADCNKQEREKIDWEVVAVVKDDTSYKDTVPGSGPYVYGVFTARATKKKDVYTNYSRMVMAGPFSPRTSPFNFGRLFYFFIIAMMGFGLLSYLQRAKRDPSSIYIRRIPGVDAIEDAVGRSTEMGRPVLYVTGIEEIQNIQTIASLLVLGRVAEMTAEYDTEIKVANFFPLTMVVAEEIVKQGYASAGRVDAHKPENVMFISAEQFAFAAGVNGIILRDKPATNIYLGRFFAESLILAETGYVTKAVQIAGTAEITQLPFFIAACDYTIIGEELYAVSAYLSREPNLLATLKATDSIKLMIIAIVGIGALVATFQGFDIGNWLIP